MMLTAKNLETLRDACDNLGYSVRRYSGRAMYGGHCHCLGIDVDRGTAPATVAFKLALELAEMGEEGVEALEALATTEWSQDSMGMGAIMYAPSLRWTEESEEDEEDKDEDATE